MELRDEYVRILEWNWFHVEGYKKDPKTNLTIVRIEFNKDQDSPFIQVPVINFPLELLDWFDSMESKLDFWLCMRMENLIYQLRMYCYERERSMRKLLFLHNTDWKDDLVVGPAGDKIVNETRKLMEGEKVDLLSAFRAACIKWPPEIGTDLYFARFYGDYREYVPSAYEEKYLDFKAYPLLHKS